MILRGYGNHRMARRITKNGGNTVWNNNGAWRVSVASLRSHNWGLRNFTWMDVQVIEDLDGKAGTGRK
jgi:hypothetical protein